MLEHFGVFNGRAVMAAHGAGKHLPRHESEEDHQTIDRKTLI
jgi:hypothetical protein